MEKRMNTLLPVRFFQSLSISGRLGLTVSVFWLLMALFGNQLAPMDVVASQQNELASWVGRYFINGNLPPNLEQYGFKPLGARLIATAQGPAALVMYQDAHGTRLAWYIRPLSPVKLPHGERKAENVMAQYWSDEHYNYALVTPLDAAATGDVRKALSEVTG